MQTSHTMVIKILRKVKPWSLANPKPQQSSRSTHIHTHLLIDRLWHAKQVPELFCFLSLSFFYDAEAELCDPIISSIRGFINYNQNSNFTNNKSTLSALLRVRCKYFDYVSLCAIVWAQVHVPQLRCAISRVSLSVRVFFFVYSFSQRFVSLLHFKLLGTFFVSPFFSTSSLF